MLFRVEVMSDNGCQMGSGTFKSTMIVEELVLLQLGKVGYLRCIT